MNKIDEKKVHAKISINENKRIMHAMQIFVGVYDDGDHDVFMCIR